MPGMHVIQKLKIQGHFKMQHWEVFCKQQKTFYLLETKQTNKKSPQKQGSQQRHEGPARSLPIINWLLLSLNDKQQ